MFSPVFIIGFSGHRPKNDAPGRSIGEIENVRPQVREAAQLMVDEAKKVGGKVEFYSGVAEGADLIVCEEILSKGLPLHVILPMSIELFKEDFEESEPNVWVRVQAVLSQVGERKECTMRVARGSHMRPDCYVDANTQMIHACDGLIAIWNGDEGDRGGTAEVVKQVKALSLPWIQVNPVDGGVNCHDLQLLTDVSRRRCGLKQMKELKRFAKCADDMDFAETRKCLGDAADNSSKQFRRATTWIILAHGFAAIVAGVAISFKGWSPLMLAGLALFELGLVGYALVLSIWHHKKKTQHAWLSCRFATELLRGINSTRGILDPLYPMILRHHQEWRRVGVAGMLTIHRESKSGESLDDQRQRYIKERIDDQIRYFKSKRGVAAPRAHNLGRVGYWTTILAVIAVSVAFAYKLSHLRDDGHDDQKAAVVVEEGEGKQMEVPGDQSHGDSILKKNGVAFVVYFLPLALPLLAGMAGSMITAMDYGRRSLRYNEMVEVLEENRRWIEVCSTRAGFVRAVARTEEILLDEQIEWLAAAEAGQGH